MIWGIASAERRTLAMPVNYLTAEEVQQIAGEALPMSKEEAMGRTLVHLELAPLDCLRCPASTQIQRSALVVIAMND